jgi:hypothetical protein
MWQTILLSLLAGAMGANSTPHFVKGITKETYPNVFGGSPVSNLVAGWAGFVVTALLVYWAHPERFPLWALASGALGALLMGMFHAWGLAIGATRGDRGATPGHPAGRSASHPRRPPLQYEPTLQGALPRRVARLGRRVWAAQSGSTGRKVLVVGLRGNLV